MISNPETATLAELDTPGNRMSVHAKWKEAAKAGFQVIPDVLFRAQSKLGLDATDVVILLNIAMHWWDVDDLPYPPPALIAKRMGVTTRAVEKRLAKLEASGFLTRGHRERKGNGDGPSIRRFDLSGLVEKLRPLGEAQIAMRPTVRRSVSKLGIDQLPNPYPGGSL